MTSTPRHQQILTTSGPAVGKITGINHLVLFARDLNVSVRFYRDILGLKVVRTQPRFSTNADSLRISAHHQSGPTMQKADPRQAERAVEISVQQVFFEMGNGELFSLYQAEEVPEKPDAPINSFLWPYVESSPPRHPQKLDHLAFNVETLAEVEWFRTHLIANGTACSDVINRKGSDPKQLFLSSIYFSDPSNNPLEISTFDKGDPAWKGYDFTNWFRDTNPTDALIDPNFSQR
jgi:catechol 2,3-dioxygenase-like lactoylglutathione lyase family enzyme